MQILKAVDPNTAPERTRELFAAAASNRSKHTKGEHMTSQITNEAPGRRRRSAGAALTTLVAVMLLASATAKFAHVPAVVGQLAAAGIADERLIFVAALEVLSAVLFLIAATRSLGLLLVSAFLGGAIATHLQHAESIVQPSMVLALAWFGAWLRHPEILWSFKRGRATAALGVLR